MVGIAAGTAKEETFTFNLVNGISNQSGDMVFRTSGSDVIIQIGSGEKKAEFKIPYSDRSSLGRITSIINEVTTHIDKTFSNAQRKV